MHAIEVPQERFAQGWQVHSLQQSANFLQIIQKPCNLTCAAKCPLQILQKLHISPGAKQGRYLIPHGPRKALLLGCSPAYDGQLRALDWGSAFLKRAR